MSTPPGLEPQWCCGRSWWLVRQLGVVRKARNNMEAIMTMTRFFCVVTIRGIFNWLMRLRDYLTGADVAPPGKTARVMNILHRYKVGIVAFAGQRRLLKHTTHTSMPVRCLARSCHNYTNIAGRYLASRTRSVLVLA